MVLAPKQNYISMEHNRQPRNKTTYLWLTNKTTNKITKELRTYNGEKNSLLYKSDVEKTETATCKRMKLEHFPIPYTEIKSK